MTTAEREQIRQKILEAIDSGKEEIRTLEELTQPIAPENAIGRVSRMDAINNRSVNEAALRHARDKQRRLSYNLDRIDTKEFGLCTRCKQAIPIGRLMLMPHSLRCVRCADR